MTSRIGGGDVTPEILKGEMAGAVEKAEARLAKQIATRASIREAESEATPVGQQRAIQRKQDLRNRRKVQRGKETVEKGKGIAEVRKISDSAREFAEENSEFQENTYFLDDIKEKLEAGILGKEEILATVLEKYKDPHMVDEALRYLEKVTGGELQRTIKELRGDLTRQTFTVMVDGEPRTLTPRDIIAGRNMGVITRDIVAEGFETVDVTPVSLRKMYHELTTNPKDPHTYFQELRAKYQYKDLKKVVKFMLHSLGQDLKIGQLESQGKPIVDSAGKRLSTPASSIEPGLLHTLITQTRVLQAILGVYNFFRVREKLLRKELGAAHIPSTPPFEEMANQFMKFVSDRFPSADKALKMAISLGVEQWLIGQIKCLEECRDAVRDVSPKHVFRSIEHRNDCYNALIEALEDLEDEVDETEERDIPDEEEAAPAGPQGYTVSTPKPSFGFEPLKTAPQPPNEKSTDIEGQGQIDADVT